MAASGVEADAENILRAITPVLEPSKHKGQAGKLAKGCAYTFSKEYLWILYFG